MSNPSGWKAEIVGVSDLGGTTGHDVYEIVSEDGYERICEYVSERHANRIVRAVNSFDDMLAVLKEVYIELCAYRSLTWPDMLNRIEAAIKKAESGQ